VRQRQRKSVLDFAREETITLEARLGGSDRQKLEEYLGGLREVERQIEQAERRPAAAHREAAPEAIPEDFRTHIRLMCDLLALAFQSDSTRIATVLFANEGNNRSFTEIGIAEGHHHLSHHQKKAENLDKVARIDSFYMEQFAHLLKKLAAARDGRSAARAGQQPGPLRRRHRRRRPPQPRRPPPGPGAAVAPAAHVKLAKPLPLNNLFLGMLARMGVERDRLGDSTGIYEDF
jgi:hypothetical protein